MDEDPTFGLEKVHGQDDRVPVSQPELRPWTAICALRIIAANGEPLDGTGFLIGPSAVLTTAHNVFDHARGGAARSIRVIPDVRNGAAPHGEFTSSTFRVAHGWRETRAPERDYGAILLDSQVGAPSRAGSIRCRVLNDAALSVATLTVAGYPQDKGKNLLVMAAGQAAQVLPQILLYDIDTNEGQSGSPILTTAGGPTLNAVGLHISGDFALNQGVRFNATVFADIQTWRTQHA